MEKFKLNSNRNRELRSHKPHSGAEYIIEIYNNCFDIFDNNLFVQDSIKLVSKQPPAAVYSDDLFSFSVNIFYQYS